MKKIYLFGLLLCMMALGLTSCNKDDQSTDTRVTYYVNMDLQGDELTLVALGTPYKDAGCKVLCGIQSYESSRRIV